MSNCKSARNERGKLKTEQSKQVKTKQNTNEKFITNKQKQKTNEKTFTNSYGAVRLYRLERKSTKSKSKP